MSEMDLPPFDTLRDSFLRFMENGMNYAEALEQFDEQEFLHAAMAEVFAHHAHIDIISHEFVTNDERRAPALWQLLTRAQFEQRNGVDSPDFAQAMELWQAGWTSEAANPPAGGFWGQTQVMSLYWRRPPRRKGKPGRRYLSTNQAWLALQKERNQTTNPPTE